MRILVLGLGALGTVYSCLLKNRGHEIIGLDLEPVIAAINEQGVKVEGIWGEHEARLDLLVTNAAELQDEQFDMVILTVKSYETGEICRQIQDLIGPNTYLLLAQNGYGNYEAASEYIAADRIVLGRVIFGAETVKWGHSRVTVIADDVLLGSPDQLIDLRILEDLAQVFNAAGIPTRASAQVMQYVWAKIIYNSALNPLGAILEVPYGQLAANYDSKSLMDEIIKEIFAVLEARGQKTPWADAQEYMEAFYSQMIPPTVLHHASMLQDIQRGRRTEIDALNGAVINLGRACGVPTPVNEVIVSLLKAKEALRAKAMRG